MEILFFPVEDIGPPGNFLFNDHVQIGFSVFSVFVCMSFPLNSLYLLDLLRL